MLIRTRLWIIGLMLAIVAGLWLWPKAAAFWDIDTCLDSGGAYISDLKTCSHSAEELARYRERAAQPR